jgi:hypothetical protein
MFRHADHTEVRMQRSKWVIGHFRTGGRHGANQGGFTGIGHPEQSDVGQQFEFEP